MTMFPDGGSIGSISCSRCHVTFDLGATDESARVVMDDFFKDHTHQKTPVGATIVDLLNHEAAEEMRRVWNAAAIPPHVVSAEWQGDDLVIDWKSGGGFTFRTIDPHSRVKWAEKIRYPHI